MFKDNNGFSMSTRGRGVESFDVRSFFLLLSTQLWILNRSLKELSNASPTLNQLGGAMLLILFYDEA